MSNKKFKVGDKVRYIGKDHLDCPEYYPAIGTVGTITGVPNNDPDCYIQWTKNSTSGNDEHWCSKEDLELVEDVDMTNEEIWRMLEPKMEKNNILVEPGVLCQGEDKLNKLLNPNILEGKYVTDVYDATVARYAIVLAYRSGYERAMKGRPFKIGEKKKKGGHWEPVDIKDVPKGGYKAVEDCLCWWYEYLGTYKKGEDGKFYQWVEDDE